MDGPVRLHQEWRRDTSLTRTVYEHCCILYFVLSISRFALYRNVNHHSRLSTALLFEVYIAGDAATLLFLGNGIGCPSCRAPTCIQGGPN